MWDKMSDYLLSVKHDPLSIGSGEVGFNDANENDMLNVSVNDNSVQCVRPPSPKKRKHASTSGGFEDLSSMISSVVTTCKGLTSPVSPSPPPAKKCHQLILLSNTYH